MTTRAEDNPFPSVLFAEHVDPSNPSAGTQRLFVDTDHILKLINSAGTVTTFAGGFANPMPTSGDIIYGGASGVATRLAKSTDGTVLTLASGLPSWATPSTGFSDPMTSRGDIIIRNASNATARLAKGSADTYLGSDGTDVSYSAVTDAKLSTSDITTNNASTSKHGFLKKLDNDSTHFMDGTGAWAVPAGSGGSVVLLEQHTASSSATLDFTTAISSTYDE